MLSLESIRHRYGERLAVKMDHLHFKAGESALLLGPSGSGKTTLMHIVAGLLKPSEGKVHLNELSVTELSGSALDQFRGRNVGIVFQKLHLIPSLSILQNLLVAQHYAGLPVNANAASETLGTLGIAEKAHEKPMTLSHGQAQRAAIARAVVNRPKLILADEPTANLDDVSAERVLSLLRLQAEACQAVLLIATHDARAKSVISRHITLDAPA